MAKLSKPAAFICTQTCYYLGRYFTAGEPYPDEWLAAGYKVGKHFAPAADAPEAIEAAKLAKQPGTHYDDPRSNEELRKLAGTFGVRGNLEKMSRKELWAMVRDHEIASARTAEPEQKGKSK